MNAKSSLRATARSVAISGIWHEIASSKLTVFPRNDGKIDPSNKIKANSELSTRIVIIQDYH